VVGPAILLITTFYSIYIHEYNFFYLVRELNYTLRSIHSEIAIPDEMLLLL